MNEDRRARPLLDRDLDPDPVQLFGRWFAAAHDAGVPLPEAMALATSTPDGAPSARMVLLKDFGEHGFAFHTGYKSRKADDLARNPRAALLFHWYELGRQVRIEGDVTPLEDAESDAYFRARPRGGQIAVWASEQGRVIGERDELDAAFRRYEVEFEGRDVPRPAAWGGYVLRPTAYEFWQHRENRLHDRFRYESTAGRGWTIVRLAP
jgi:pyridoxamine 5'-phosphate oxidase